jgi:hypothetical protein
MQYYVYALIDPRDNKPFYIGKGKDRRVQSHFKEAEQIPYGITLSEISEDEMEELERFGNVEKLVKIRELFDEGYKFEDMARVLAKGLDEESAFTIECFLIKTMYGDDNLTNRVIGKHSDRFRPYESWNALKGYDVLLIPEDENSGRISKLNAMIAEKLDKPLKEIEKAFPEIEFDKPKVLDAGEMGIEADIEGTRLKIAIRRKNIYCELRCRKVSQKQWLCKHFEMLEKVELLRKDIVFLPNCWKGTNMTSDTEIMIERVNLLIKFVRIKSKNELSEELIKLLT